MYMERKWVWMCVLDKGVSACVWKDNEFKYVYEAGVCVCV